MAHCKLYNKMSVVVYGDHLHNAPFLSKLDWLQKWVSEALNISLVFGQQA